MNTLYLLKFEFKEYTKQKINEIEKRFYLSTVKAVCEEEDVDWIVENEKSSKGLFFSTVVYTSKDIVSPYVLVEKFMEWANANAKILKGDNFLESNIYLAIDLRGIVRDQEYFPLFLLISDALKNVRLSNNIKFFLFLDSLFLNDDILYPLLEEHVQSRKVFLIDNRGKYLPSEENSQFDTTKFKEKLQNTEVDKKLLLNTKIIRRLGHFKVNESDTFCNRYFYDGLFCKSEIKILVGEFLEKNLSKRANFEYIFYTTKFSPWLKESLNNLSGDLIGNGSNVYKRYKTAIGTNDLKKVEHTYDGGEILLVTDLMNSGTTMQNEIENLFKLLPNLKSENLLLLSILNRKGKGSGDSNRSLLINENKFIIKYFLDVELIRTNELDGKCRLCELKLPFTSIENEQLLKLTSYDFWDLSDEAKYEEEKYGREDRFLKRITKMSKWFDRNASFIIYKFYRHLLYLNIDPNIGTIFIYPNELMNNNRHKVEMSITPSGKLAGNLKVFFDAQEIGIPRTIIDKFKDKKANLTDLDDNTDDWIKALTSKSSNNNFIIIDEFQKEGETFKSIYRIMEHFNRIPKCYFPVIDFNPSRTAEYKKEYKEVKFLNLYEFNNP